MRALVALCLGAAIGLERQLSHHEAGLKTNALVSLGTALFVAVSLHFQEPDRVLAQVVTGVGFLGAGMIMRDGLQVRGLNTAATSWCAAAVGMISGSGDLGIATSATAIVVTANIVLRQVVLRIDAWQRARGVVPDEQKGH